MSKFYGSNLNEGNEISMATSPFFTDQVFESREELMQWVQNTAFSLGYIIVTRRSKAKENGVVYYVTLICDRGGEYKFKESSKKSGTKKTNCKFRLIAKSQHTSIYESFEKSRIVLKHRHNLPCFRLLWGFVALEVLDILEGELQRSSRHQLDSSNCGCKLCHSYGLPCTCMLSVYLNSGGECIPMDSIDVFWRKLDLSPSTSVENEDICCDGVMEIADSEQYLFVVVMAKISGSMFEINC
ncbi:hypothetical protein GOBAR_AA00842 [Gossypium barbadense]|uniref:FAR1 domain-containing protein n=1 Tax=Gossypium barbadense TaxID=3634 RepID=A0A2P5YVT6_GOSBA|nr:hypothetical protein GOBAR_AA00842 [Gossypium barbadense]